MHWFIGDVHGYIDELVNLLNKIREQDNSPTFIFVGDYCDRGPCSDKVVDLAISLKAQNHVFLRGNHDDVFDWILNGSSKSHMKEHVVGPVSDQKVVMWWMQNGLKDALDSYGYDTMRLAYAELPWEWDSIMDDIRSCVPAAHREFYASLPLSWENDTHFALHAYLDPSIVLTRFGLSSIWNKQERIEEALWSRFPISIQQIKPEWGKIGVFGHTPVFHYGSSEVIKSKDIRLIDTGIAFNGSISALCMETDEVISV